MNPDIPKPVPAELPEPSFLVEPSAPSETPKPPDLGEIAKLGENWQQTINLVWSTNRTMLDRDYVKAEEIVKEEGPLKGKSVTDQEVQAEVQKRQAEQIAARTIDPDEIAKQMGKKPEDAEVAAEVKRRKELIVAADILYTIQDTRVAAAKAAESAVTTELDKIKAEKRKLKLEQLNQTAKTADPSAAEITTLPADGEAEINKTSLTDEKQEEIRKGTISQYYDEKSGIYHHLNPQDGTPLIDQTVSYADSFGVVYAELQRVAEEGTSPETQHAQELLKTLKYNPQEKAFVVLSSDQVLKREIELATEAMREAQAEIALLYGEFKLDKIPIEGGHELLMGIGAIIDLDQGSNSFYGLAIIDSALSAGERMLEKQPNRTSDQNEQLTQIRKRREAIQKHPQYQQAKDQFRMQFATGMRDPSAALAMASGPIPTEDLFNNYWKAQADRPYASSFILNFLPETKGIQDIPQMVANSLLKNETFLARYRDCNLFKRIEQMAQKDGTLRETIAKGMGLLSKSEWMSKAIGPGFILMMLLQLIQGASDEAAAAGAGGQGQPPPH